MREIENRACAYVCVWDCALKCLFIMTSIAHNINPMSTDQHIRHWIIIIVATASAAVQLHTHTISIGRRESSQWYACATNSRFINTN